MEESASNLINFYTNRIEELKTQLTKSNNKIEKIKDFITKILNLTLISSVVNLKEQKDKEQMLEVFKTIQNGLDRIIDGSDE